jgi:hypothetical protein
MIEEPAKPFLSNIAVSDMFVPATNQLGNHKASVKNVAHALAHACQVETRLDAC